MSKFKVGDVVRGLGDAPWIEHKIHKVFPRTVTSLGEDAWGYNLEGITNTYTAKELVMVSPKDPTAPVDNRKEWRVRQKVGQMLWGWAKVSLDGKNIDVKIDNGATYLNQDASEWQEMSAPGLWSKWVDLTGGPAKPSPIVTKRDVKPGTYGILNVMTNIGPSNNVSIQIGAGVDGFCYTAEQLREAAHTLNQIAEVLEENASW